MNNQQAEDLLLKYKAGTASREEKSLVENWYANFKDKAASVPEDQLIADQKESWMQFEKEYGKGRVTPLWSRLTAGQVAIRVAAAILIIVSAGAFFYNTGYFDNKKAPVVLAKDIAPGRNTATLTLATGEKIVLSEAVSGKLAEEAGISITKTEDGQIVYEIASQDRKEGPLLYNTLATARGEQYRIVLPDGSKVWLNAASSLKYPASFASLKEREVVLSGEAYFEVAHDKSHPFIVNTGKQEVEVLGTHFNINAYTDESAVRTTLLEGSVRVSAKSTQQGDLSSRQSTGQQLVLDPNQQSILTANSLKMETVDSEAVALWKEGKFGFDSEEIGSVMRQVARWYNVEVVYADDVRDVKITGSVSRFTNISTLLEKLQQAGMVKFKVEGTKVIVSK